MKRFYSTIFTLLITLINYAQTTHTVNAGNYYYYPSSLTIEVGDSVAWTNNGGFHDVNGDIEKLTGEPYNNPETFASPATSSSFIFGYRFSVPGTYNYDCSVGNHAAEGMVGTIIVQSQPTNALDVVLSSKINVYPNPSDEIINISCNESISSVSVYNLLGKKIYEKSISNIHAQININEFNRDIYLLKVTTQSGDDIFHKIIKN